MPRVRAMRTVAFASRPVTSAGASTAAHYVEQPDCPSRWGANQEVEDASEEEAETGGSDRENGHTKEKENVTR